jgi:ankyrin repeat protein
VGADINARDSRGRTPLWWATKSDHPFIVKRLLAEDVLDINEVSTGTQHHFIMQLTKAIG